MAEIPSVEQVGGAAAYLTSQAGISNTILAGMVIALCAWTVWRERENKKDRIASEKRHQSERLEVRIELFGNKELGVRGSIPEMWDRIEIIRKELWDSVNAMLATTNDALKALESRRREDSISHFSKLEDVLNEVKDMSQSDMHHHARVEGEVKAVSATLREQTTRMGDLIHVIPSPPPAWNGTKERRTKRNG